jgi:hypothetical protein
MSFAWASGGVPIVMPELVLPPAGALPLLYAAARYTSDESGCPGRAASSSGRRAQAIASAAYVDEEGRSLGSRRPTFMT